MTNHTNYDFQINLWFSEKCLEGELLVSKELSYGYHVFEKEHEFLKIEGAFFRKNEIWREKFAKYEGGKILETEMVTKIFSKVMYPLNEELIEK